MSIQNNIDTNIQNPSRNDFCHTLAGQVLTSSKASWSDYLSPQIWIDALFPQAARTPEETLKTLEERAGVEYSRAIEALDEELHAEYTQAKWIGTAVLVSHLALQLGLLSGSVKVNSLSRAIVAAAFHAIETVGVVYSFGTSRESAAGSRLLTALATCKAEVSKGNTDEEAIKRIMGSAIHGETQSPLSPTSPIFESGVCLEGEDRMRNAARAYDKVISSRANVDSFKDILEKKDLFEQRLDELSQREENNIREYQALISKCEIDDDASIDKEILMNDLTLIDKEVLIDEECQKQLEQIKKEHSNLESELERFSQEYAALMDTLHGLYQAISTEETKSADKNEL